MILYTYALTLFMPKPLKVDNASCGLPSENAKMVSPSQGLLLIVANQLH